MTTNNAVPSKLIQYSLWGALALILIFNAVRPFPFQAEKASVLWMIAGVLLTQFGGWDWRVRLAHPLVLGVALLLGGMIAATVFALTPHLSFTGWAERYHGLLTWLSYGVLFMTAYRYGGWLRRALFPIVFLCTHLLIAGAILNSGVNPRLISLAGSPSYLAAWLVLSIPLLVYYGWMDDRYQQVVPRWLVALTIAGACVLLLLTQTVGAVLSLAIVGVLLLVHHLPRHRLTAALVVAIPCGMLALTVVMRFDVAILSSVRDIVLAETNTRKQIWEGAITVIAQISEPLHDGFGQPDALASSRVWVGYGLDNNQFLQSRASDDFTRYEVLDRFHNLFFDSFIMTGIIGLVGWVIVVAVLSLLFWWWCGYLTSQTLLWWLMVQPLVVLATVFWGRMTFINIEAAALLPWSLMLGWSLGSIVWMRLPIHADVPQRTEKAYLFASVLALLLTVQFAFITIASGVLFWVVCGLFISASSQSEAIPDEDTTQEVWSGSVRVVVICLVHSIGALFVSTLLSYQFPLWQQMVLLGWLLAMHLMVRQSGLTWRLLLGDIAWLLGLHAAYGLLLSGLLNLADVQVSLMATGVILALFAARSSLTVAYLLGLSWRVHRWALIALLIVTVFSVRYTTADLLQQMVRFERGQALSGGQVDAYYRAMLALAPDVAWRHLEWYADSDLVSLEEVRNGLYADLPYIEGARVDDLLLPEP